MMSGFDSFCTEFGEGVLYGCFRRFHRIAAAPVIRQQVITELDGGVRTRHRVEAGTPCKLPVLEDKERPVLKTVLLLKTDFGYQTLFDFVLFKTPGANQSGNSRISPQFESLVEPGFVPQAESQSSGLLEIGNFRKGAGGVDTSYDSFQLVSV